MSPSRGMSAAIPADIRGNRCAHPAAWGAQSTNATSILPMNLILTIRVAFRALGKNKLRAGLTVLGVVIGIAAVTTMVSIGESASALVQEQLQGLGTNVLLIFPG